MITTNGLLADTRGRELVDTGKVFKLSISLHSFEANRYGIALEDYLKSCFSLAERASERGTLSFWIKLKLKIRILSSLQETCTLTAIQTEEKSPFP